MTIPESVIKIDHSAFEKCSSLTSITIPASVKEIDWSFGYDNVLSGCSGLKEIKVDKANRVYDSRDNCNAIIETNSNTLLAGCQNTRVPNNVTAIARSAFFGCSKLHSITIPDSVTEIGSSAFSHCTELGTVVLSKSLTKIGDTAFEHCEILSSIVIPNSVTTIGANAFLGCSRLTTVTLPDSITELGYGALYDFNTKLKAIYVPKGSKAKFEQLFEKAEIDRLKDKLIEK